MITSCVRSLVVPEKLDSGCAEIASGAESQVIERSSTSTEIDRVLGLVGLLRWNALELNPPNIGRETKLS